MRMSRLFFETLREVPAAADTPSHQLLLRAGLVHQVAAGIFEFLPLGLRVKRKIERILRQEMERIDGQEVQMPVVQPAELWQRSGRWYVIGADMARAFSSSKSMMPGAYSVAMVLPGADSAVIRSNSWSCASGGR